MTTILIPESCPASVSVAIVRGQSLFIRRGASQYGKKILKIFASAPEDKQFFCCPYLNFNYFCRHPPPSIRQSKYENITAQTFNIFACPPSQHLKNVLLAHLKTEIFFVSPRRIDSVSPC